MAAISFPILTERLLLRPFTAADVPAMREVYEDVRVMRWVGTGPFCHPSMTSDILREYAEHQQRHGFSYWALVERASLEVVGDAGLYRLPRPEMVLELGYTLRSDRWGRGYATEAASACLSQALDVVGAPGVIALIEPANTASIRVAEKLSLVHDGTRMVHGRSHLLYRSTSR